MSESGPGRPSSSSDAIEKKITCPECGRECRNNQSLAQHSISVHGVNHALDWEECERCGEEFSHKPSIDYRRFCSRGCKEEWQAENVRGPNHPRWKEGTHVERECVHCGDTFRIAKSQLKRNRGSGRYCSRSCMDEWRSENWVRGNNPLYTESIVECDNCGQEFDKRPAKIDSHDHHFCSRVCQGEWMSEHNTGENHPRWNGGHVEYGELWYSARRDALDRDNYTCQYCGKHRDKLEVRVHVHHIKPVREFENVDDAHELNNLVVLCNPCHNKWEGVYLRPDNG